MAEEQTTAPEVQSEQNSQPVSFLDSLPEEIRTDTSLQAIKDVGQLAKGYVHAQRMVGADKIPIPTQNSSPDDWNAVFTKLGKPETVDGYKLQYELQDGASETPINNFKQKAHELGLLPQQAQGLLDFYSGLENSSAEKVKADTELAKANAITELRKEFGLAYDEKINKADNVFKTFFAKDMAELRLEDGTPVGSHPGFIRALVEMSKNFSEDNLGTGQEESGILTPDEAQREVNKILVDKNHPYHLKNHPGHQDAVQEVFKLNNMIYGVSSG